MGALDLALVLTAIGHGDDRGQVKKGSVKARLPKTGVCYIVNTAMDSSDLSDG